MLKITALQYTYAGSSTISYPDWQLEKGTHALILGGSGSGKTTLLHLLGALMQPTSGVVEIAGHSLAEKSTITLDRFRGEHIGIVFQKPHLIKSLSVKENLLLAQYLGGQKQNTSGVMKVLERLDISELAARKVHQLSEGQAQRVAIARAVVNKPKLLLADEPTASLDDQNCHRVTTLLKEEAEASQATLIIATHDHRIKTIFQNQLAL